MYVENQICENSEHYGERRIFGASVPIGSTYYFDGIQIEQLHASTTYCDGSQTNCSWAGVPNASTSTRNNQYIRMPMPSQIANLYDKDWTLMLRFQMPALAINTASRISTGEGLESLVYLGDGGASSTIGIRYLKSHSGANQTGESRLKVTMTDENGDDVYIYGNIYGGGEGDVNAKLVRDAFYNLAIVYDNTAKVVYFYLDGTRIAYSASLVNRHFKNPAYAYLGSTGQLNPAPLYSSFLLDIAVIFGTALPPYNISQIVSAMQDADYIPPASFLIYSFYDFNLSSLEATIGSSINEDVRRVRNRVFWTNMSDRAHFQNRANKYQIKLQFQEV
jgi:hypothetical protein